MGIQTRRTSFSADHLPTPGNDAALYVTAAAKADLLPGADPTCVAGKQARVYL